ncbi:MAG: hypothetical protein ACI9VS_003655 [Candidatus Binatia bacterium]|jgi:hypothetical protein
MEYLVARRLITGLERARRQRAVHEEDRENGWNDATALCR